MTEVTYKKPGWFTKHVFNPAVALASRLGIGVAGSRRLTVRGRKSGKPHSTPVNPLEIDGVTDLVAPRGNTQWVRNLRAAGEGELHHGREATRFHGEEIADADKLPILKTYLDKWAWEVGSLMGIDADASDDELREVAPRHPAFEITFQD